MQTCRLRRNQTCETSVLNDWSNDDGSIGKREVTVGTPTLSLEVITLPVSDVERALRFYVDKVGFTLDVGYKPNDAFFVVQLTPPGSSCSIQIGKGVTDAPVGSLRNVYLVVTDLEASRSGLLERGVEVGEIRHKTPIGAWDGGFAPRARPSARRLCQLRRLACQQGKCIHEIGD